MKPVKVGVVGCGDICDIYFKNIAKFDNLEAVACADLILERAQKKAETYGCKAMTVNEIMSSPEVEVILNLTIPAAHHDIDMAALHAGKHVYSEKPLSITMEDAKEILDLAKKKNLLVGCAPDTFLGARMQTMRKMIDDGWIGKPVAATAFMTNHGTENWHPNPVFHYKTGAGPLFDMGPYYVTALLALLGPAKRLCGITNKYFEKRLITSQPLAGQYIDVEVPTHVSGTIEFQNGVTATLITSFDIWDSNLPRLEIYGTEGTISMTDPDPLAGPDIFHGVIKFRRKDEADWYDLPYDLPRKEEATPWATIPSCYDYNQNSRALGLADMARAIRSGGKFRANGDMANHVLEIMLGIYESSESGTYYTLKSSCELPEVMPMNRPEYSVGE